MPSDDDCYREYKRFVAAHGDRLLGKAKSAASFVGLGVDAGKDILQDALVKVYLAWHRIDEGGHLAYALRAVVNVAIDHARRETRRPEGHVDGIDVDLIGAPAAGTANDPFPNLGPFIAALSNDQIWVLHEYYVAGHTFEELADATGRPSNTIRSHHRRALKKLNTALLAARENPN